MTKHSPSMRPHPSRAATLLSCLALAAAVMALPPAHAKGGGNPPAPSPAPAPTPAPAPAQQAIVLSFDDFIASPFGVPMPAGYGGFVWGDRWFAMQSIAAPVGNYLAVGSGSSILIRRADGTPFYFDGADFWSRRGLDAVGDFYFVLYHQGQTVYNGLTAKKGKKVFTDEPTLLKPDYAGPVDAIAFAFDSNSRDWNHLAMDKLRMRIDLK